MSIQQRGSQNYKGSRSKNRAHDSPEGEKARRTGSGTAKPKEIEMIEDWLSRVHFKKAALGGVSETDVWKKISELNEMYQTALTAERARYDMLLQTYEKRRSSVSTAGRRRSDSTASRTAAEGGTRLVSGVSVEPAEQSVSWTAAEITGQSSSHSAVRREKSSRAAGEIKETRDIPASSRSRDAPKQTDTKVMNRTASQVKKSARPKGVPFTEVDWLDDDEDDWFDFDSRAASSKRSSNSRSREESL